MVIKSGKIVFTGTNNDVLKEFDSKNKFDAEGKSIFPGFIDAHCHFYGYGKGLTELDLVGTSTFKEVLDNTKYYAREHNLYPENAQINIEYPQWIVGRGWDQNDWPEKVFPNKSKLDSLFPNVPVLLKRIDGHAVLVNQKALSIAGFTTKTKISGGELIIENGKLSGVLIDNAADSLEKLISVPNKISVQNALLMAQQYCLAVGLTTIDDAGLDKSVINIIDGLQKTEKLKIRVYAMLTPNKENLDYYLKNGIYKTDKLNVCSFKFYGDGALGSRGACLKEEYSDKKNWKGFLLSEINYYKKYAELISKTNFQMNTHCIGDSAAKVLLDIYSKYCSEGDKRWRIEHAQVIGEKDFEKFNKNIIPSVQPTHATSDMYWAEERLGKNRIRGAYAYKQLLNKAELLALGTDFPVENISPFKTFYAAVVRKDSKNFPEGGFQKSNALSREETIKGMTIWAAYSNFEEKEKGSLEPGKWADFVLLDTDLMTCEENNILNTKVLSTFISGKEVYTAKVQGTFERGSAKEY